MGSLFWSETAALFSELQSSIARSDKHYLSNGPVKTLTTKQDFHSDAIVRPDKVLALNGRDISLNEEI